MAEEMEVSDGLTTTENDQLSEANEQINSDVIQHDGVNGIKSSEKAPSDFEKEKAGNDSDNNDIGNESSSKQNEGNKHTDTNGCLMSYFRIPFLKN